MKYQREFVIGAKEARELYRSQALHHAMKGVLGLSLVAALVALLYMPEATRANKASMWAYCITVAVLAFFLLIFLVRLRADRQIKKSVRQQEGGSYRQEVSIDAFGVHVVVGKKKASAAYDKIIRVKETKKAFYVFITQEDGWILPKAQMEDPREDSRTIRRIFRTVMLEKDLKLRKD